MSLRVRMVVVVVLGTVTVEVLSGTVDGATVEVVLTTSVVVVGSRVVVVSSSEVETPVSWEITEEVGEMAENATPATITRARPNDGAIFFTTSR